MTTIARVVQQIDQQTAALAGYHCLVCGYAINQHATPDLFTPTTEHHGCHIKEEE